MQEKAHKNALFLCFLPVLLIIFSTTDLPEVLAHGFATIGEVLLLREVDLVLGHVAQVVLTRPNHRLNGGKARLRFELVCSDRRGAFRLFLHVQTVAVVATGRGCTVGREQHTLAAVLRV